MEPRQRGGLKNTIQASIHIQAKLPAAIRPPDIITQAEATSSPDTTIARPSSSNIKVPMAENIQLGIKVKVYGTDAASDIRGLSSGVNVLGDSAKKTATSIER